MKGINFLSALIFLINTACGGNDNDSIDTPEEIKEPVAVLLVFPEENSECNEGTIINDSQSKVTFRWNTAEYADSYTLNLQNLDSQTSSEIESSSNAVDIILDRGTAYKWYVVSNSDKSTETVQSESWQFYNAAPGVVNYAPFPAVAIDPVNGSTVASTSGKVMLSWQASDLDDDIVSYEVLFGINNPPTTTSGDMVETNFEVNGIADTSYYWFVKTTDSENNTSVSEVFSFAVE